jgi:serine/threonine-protein kinase HipA
MEMLEARVFISQTEVGKLWKDQDGYHFKYHKIYLENPINGAVSFTLPLQEEPFLSKVIFSFFDGLIPEGWLLNLVQKNWKIDPQDRMALLMRACLDCIGNVSVVGVFDEN